MFADEDVEESASAANLSMPRDSCVWTTCGQRRRLSEYCLRGSGAPPQQDADMPLRVHRMLSVSGARGVRQWLLIEPLAFNRVPLSKESDFFCHA